MEPKLSSSSFICDDASMASFSAPHRSSSVLAASLKKIEDALSSSNSKASVVAPDALTKVKSATTNSRKVSASAVHKPPVDERVQVDDVQAIIDLMAQRHSIHEDRKKLVSLSDVVTGIVAQQEALLPRALTNISLAKQIEVLLEEVAAKKLEVKKTRHLVDVATEEHERLLQENDMLLGIAKRKEDEHAQALKQCRIAGAIDADAHAALLQMEAQRVKVIGFTKVFTGEIERVSEVANKSKTSADASPSAAGASVFAWGTTISGGAKVRHGPVSSSADAPSIRKSPVHKKKTSTLQGKRDLSRIQGDSRSEQSQAKGSGDGDGSGDRRMFELRMAGHELLRSFDALAARAQLLDVDVSDAVDVAAKMRSVMNESSEGRSSLWMFDGCKKTLCVAARERLARLEQRHATEAALRQAASGGPRQRRSMSYAAL